MVVAVMVGGPLHGRTRAFAGAAPPSRVLVMRECPIVVDFDEPISPVGLDDVQPHRYELAWYGGYGCWPPCGPMTRQAAYLCRDEPTSTRPAHEDDEQARYFRVLADDLWRTEAERALPVCVVPDCQEKGRITFTAAERGRLAGQEWRRGDEIRVCPKHGHDIYRARGAWGMDQLAEWLRPDATWDPFGTYDGEAEWQRGAEILKRTARMLRLAIPERGRS